MGDIADTDFDTFCQELAANYDTTHIILITAAPPCKDHSRVRDTPPGLSGDDGSLLQQMTNIDLTIRQRLPQHTIRSLMENVLPHHTIKSQFDNISRQLGYNPLIVDAADGHITSRPRLPRGPFDHKKVGHPANDQEKKRNGQTTFSWPNVVRQHLSVSRSGFSRILVYGWRCGIALVCELIVFHTSGFVATLSILL